MKKVAIVYWLLPAKPERELFRDFIRILGKEFRGPSFEPHLTLFFARHDKKSAKNILQSIQARPISLNGCAVAFSDKFTKTLFARFRSNPALRNLVAALSRAARSRATAPRDPHVSLIYKEIPRVAKKELAAAIKLPFRSATFDSICAVRLTLPVRTEADVRKWKIIARKSLRG
jgi:2'-5' RNA ligase